MGITLLGTQDSLLVLSLVCLHSTSFLRIRPPTPKAACVGHRRVILHAVEILRKELAQMPAAPMPVAASPPSSSRGSSARTLSFSSPSALPGMCHTTSLS